MGFRIGKIWTLIIVGLVLATPISAITNNNILNTFALGAGKAPVANNMTIQLESNTLYTGKLNATNAKSYNITTKPKQGTITLNKTNGNFIYTPNTNFTGNDSFNYNANNGTTNSNIATVKITITPSPVTNTSKIIYVATNGTDRNDGLTPTHPKRNIISTINSANPGDTIKIGPGTYTDIPLDINKNITLSGTTQNTTIINAQQQTNRCINIQAGVHATITDLTITNSNAYINDFSLNTFGAGIYNSGELTLTRLTISNNKARYGGGIYNKGLLSLNQAIIKNNTATEGFGGGIDSYYGTIIINNSIITNNKVKNYGGGIYTTGTMRITNSIISNNIAGTEGGGICSPAYLTIEDSIISNNTVTNGYGGGLSTNYLYLYGSIISNNTAHDAGGLFNNFKAYVDDQTIVINNTPTNFGGNPIIPA
jgi:predicted outer membrane repeat protein